MLWRSFNVLMLPIINHLLLKHLNSSNSHHNSSNSNNLSLPYNKPKKKNCRHLYNHFFDVLASFKFFFSVLHIW